MREKKKNVIMAILCVVLLSGCSGEKVNPEKKNLEKQETQENQVLEEHPVLPEIALRERCVFTNDIEEYQPLQLIGPTEQEQCTAIFQGFRKVADLDIMDAKAIQDLEDEIAIPSDQEALAEVKSDVVPTEEGIYQSVLKISGEQGNSRLEEIYIILDKTGALIEEVEDQVIEVKNIEEAPEIKPEQYVIHDNVDGRIKPENIICKLEIRDAEKNEYIVRVSYTDRAGNVSKAEFLITTVEQRTQDNQPKESQGASQNRHQEELAEAPQESHHGESPEAPQESHQEEQPKGQQEVPQGVPQESQTSGNLTPAQQAVVAAGYYNVIPVGNDAYAVMIHGGEDGKVLYDYLASIGCTATYVGGGWIDESKDQYILMAEGVYRIDTSVMEW